MQIFAVLAVLLTVSAASAITWQHLRYLRTRRDVVQDRQTLLHPANAFHVVLCLAVADDADVVEEVRKLRDDLEAGGNAKLVYAGQSFTAMESSQVPNEDWSAVALFEFSSRETFDAMAASESYRAALARFRASYAHGFERYRGFNLALPIILLGERLRQIVFRVPAIFPFEPAEEQSLSMDSDRRERLSENLQRLRPVNAEAVVILNLIRRGTKEQQAADNAYARQMLAGFAEVGCGPMHMGRAVSVEGDARFDQVALVYYPGADYFVSMLHSKFFNGIIGGKQLGDTLVAPTVPITDRL